MKAHAGVALDRMCLAERCMSASLLAFNIIRFIMQAHAWVALGKMCLADEALAKKCVPMFVQELERAQLPAVRNNIMVSLQRQL